MRELTVRIRFTSACLGSVKKHVKDEVTGKTWPTFFMPRTTDGKIRFESSWWTSSLTFAAKILCRHHRAVEGIYWDVIVDGRPDTNVDNFFKRYFNDKGSNNGRSKSRFVKHEAFLPGDVIGVNCIVPETIGDDDFWKLMDLVGRFRGISPYEPRKYGHFTVDTIRPKDRTPQETNHVYQGRKRDTSNASDDGREANS